MEAKNTLKKIFRTKKGLIGTGIVILAGVLVWLGLTSFKRPDTYQLALDNVAEARFYMKNADDDIIGKVQLYSGVREEDYKQDGIATPTKAFTVISVDPKDNKTILGGTIIAEITVDNDQPQTITLEKNPYGTNYAADLGKTIESTSMVKIAFKSGEETVTTVNLSNPMPDDAISWEKALEIAAKELTEQISTDKRIESYVKILCDNTTNTPYWFVSFAAEDGRNFFVVVSPDGRIIGKSEK
jgi:hypothetical protein